MQTAAEVFGSSNADDTKVKVTVRLIGSNVKPMTGTDGKPIDCTDAETFKTHMEAVAKADLTKAQTTLSLSQMLTLHLASSKIYDAQGIDNQRIYRLGLYVPENRVLENRVHKAGGDIAIAEDKRKKRLEWRYSIGFCGTYLVSYEEVPSLIWAQTQQRVTTLFPESTPNGGGLMASAGTGESAFIQLRRELAYLYDLTFYDKLNIFKEIYTNFIKPLEEKMAEHPIDSPNYRSLRTIIEENKILIRQHIEEHLAAYYQNPNENNLLQNPAKAEEFKQALDRKVVDLHWPGYVAKYLGNKQPVTIAANSSTTTVATANTTTVAATTTSSNSASADASSSNTTTTAAAATTTAPNTSTSVSASSNTAITAATAAITALPSNTSTAGANASNSNTTTNAETATAAPLTLTPAQTRVKKALEQLKPRHDITFTILKHILTALNNLCQGALSAFNYVANTVEGRTKSAGLVFSGVKHFAEKEKERLQRQEEEHRSETSSQTDGSDSDKENGSRDPSRSPKLKPGKMASTTE